MQGSNVSLFPVMPLLDFRGRWFDPPSFSLSDVLLNRDPIWRIKGYYLVATHSLTLTHSLSKFTSKVSVSHYNSHNIDTKDGL